VARLADSDNRLFQLRHVTQPRLESQASIGDQTPVERVPTPHIHESADVMNYFGALAKILISFAKGSCGLSKYKGFRIDYG
jgi:hypothetical protein